jgi:hypothetical protein
MAHEDRLRRAEGGGRIGAAPPARNRWRLFVFAALSCVGLTSARYGDSAAGSANRGTVPPSSYGAGLVSTPSPVDNTNNLVITGNVSGGKSFRGGLPYGSTTSLGGRSGSTSLDPFLRYSSIPDGLGNGPSDYSPFYSPTGTVPKMPPGDNGVFAPGSPKVAAGRMLSASEQPADVISRPQAPQPQVSAGRTNARGDTTARTRQGLRPVPLTATPDEMRQILAGAPEKGSQGWNYALGDPNPPAGKGSPTQNYALGAPSPSRPSTQNTQPMSAEEYRRQVDQLQRDLDRVKTSASEFEQSLRADRQSYTPAPGQTPAEATPSLATGEALRRILLPQSPSQPPPQYPTVNSRGSQGLSWGNEGVSQSRGQLTLRVPGSTSPAGGILPTPGSTLGYLGAAPPDQMPGRTAAALPELTLVSPQNPLTGARARAATEPRVPLYVPPAAPAPSGSDVTGPKDRMDAIFTPQTQAPADAAGSGGGRTVGRLPAMQRVENTVRAFDTPAAILARSLPDATDSAPSTATSGGAGSTPRLVIAGAPVQSDADLASAVQDLGGGVPLPPRPAPAVGTERARIAVEPAPEMVPSQAAAVPTPAVLSGGPGAETMEIQPKSPSPAPAPKPAHVVLPPDTPFDRYLRSAQLSMQQGQYAKAAESFSLAAGCNPKDVRPALGRSHALFAAGEYLSSAVYLAKAIELDPRHVLQKSDLLAAVGGPDVFVQRITGLEKRAKAGDAPVLHLLLAYLYQQMDRPQEATAALQAARKGLPSSLAVELLGRTIAGGSPG